jgi:hypothetical protein
VVADEKDVVEDSEEELVLPAEIKDFPPLTSMLDLFNWYLRNLCQPELRDCRGYRVLFREEDFVHLIKLVDRYGREPRNRTMAVANIKSGQLKLFHGGRRTPANFSLQRAKDLVIARSLVERPDMIVPNWQSIARGNPGDAYIRNFGSESRARYRVLICGYGGQKRLPITIFPRQRFSERETSVKLWP